MNYELEHLIIKNAHIIFRNFRGEEGRYNRSGDRNFCVVIDDPDWAQQLREAGWNVRYLEPNKDYDEGLYYLPVEVSYKKKPPRIVVKTSKSRVEIDEDSIETLDYADILNAKLSVRPYYWEVNGKSGIKAYLKSLHVTLEEDELDDDDE